MSKNYDCGFKVRSRCMRSTTIRAKKKQEKGAWVYLPGHGLNEPCLTLVASVGSEAAFKSSSSIE